MGVTIEVSPFLNFILFKDDENNIKIKIMFNNYKVTNKIIDTIYEYKCKYEIDLKVENEFIVNIDNINLSPILLSISEIIKDNEKNISYVELDPNIIKTRNTDTTKSLRNLSRSYLKEIYIICYKFVLKKLIEKLTENCKKGS